MIRTKLSVLDPNFQSELIYDGYQSIEDYDNNSYNSRKLELEGDLEGELRIEDRPDDSDMGEENPVDPQENQK